VRNLEASAQRTLQLTTKELLMMRAARVQVYSFAADRKRQAGPMQELK
jgi:hypothetical protein